MKGFYIVAVLMFTAAEGAARFYLSPNKTSWQEANTTCEVATPDITYSETGYEVDVDLSHLNVALYSTRMWTDYTMAYYIFSYLGCVREQDVNTSHVANFTTRLEPGACFSACGKRGIFGIREDRSLRSMGAACYCFPISLTMANNRYTTCTKPCQNPPNTACGAEGFLSMYSTARGISTNQVKNLDAEERVQNCIAYEPISATYYWQKCSKLLVVTCVDGDQIKHHDISPWRYLAARCFHDNTYPLSDVTAANITHIPTIYQLPGTNVSWTWTNMFRSPVLSTRHESVTPFEYGYLIAGEYTAYLEFTYRKVNVSAVALCLKDPEETSHPSTKLTSEIPDEAAHTSTKLTSEIPDEAAHTSTTLSVPMAGSTKMTSSSNDHTQLEIGVTQNTDTDGQPVYVYVILTVAVAAVVAAVVVVGVILIRKRIKQPRQPSSAEKTSKKEAGGATGNQPEGPADDYITACYEEPATITGGHAPTASHANLTARNQVGGQDGIDHNYEAVTDATYINKDIQTQSTQSRKDIATVKQTPIDANYLDMSGSGQTGGATDTTPHDGSRADDDSGGYYAHNIYQGLTTDNSAEASRVYLRMNELPNTAATSGNDGDNGGYYVHNIYQGLTTDTSEETSRVYLQMNELPKPVSSNE